MSTAPDVVEAKFTAGTDGIVGSLGEGVVRGTVGDGNGRVGGLSDDLVLTGGNCGKT